MTGLIEKHLVPTASPIIPFRADCSFGATLPEGADMPRFLHPGGEGAQGGGGARQRVPGRMSSDPCQAFRLNFSTPTDEAMEKGLERLGGFAAEFLRR